MKLDGNAKQHRVRGDEHHNRERESPSASVTVEFFHRLHRSLGQYILKTTDPDRTLIDGAKPCLSQ